jgi:hypothetical protein
MPSPTPGFSAVLFPRFGPLPEQPVAPWRAGRLLLPWALLLAYGMSGAAHANGSASENEPVQPGAESAPAADAMDGSPQADEPPPFKRPPFRPLRQDEDWSVLAGRDLSTTGGLLDPLKYRALSDDGAIWISIGGHVRLRYEDWKNFNFGETGAAEADDRYLLTRASLHADLHLGERWRVFAEGRTAQSTERELPGGRRAVDVDTIDLQQGFVDGSFDVGDGELRARVGRQMLAFGRQRLVSPLFWGNAMRAWDGVDLRWQGPDWTVNALYTWFVPVHKTRFNETDWQERLWGLYGRHGALGALDGLELYALGLERDDQAFNGTVGDEWRLTLGTRLFGKASKGRFDWEAEAAFQTGEVGSDDVAAGMAALQAGFNMLETEGKPRLFVGLDWASGDSSPGGSVGTYNQLYPLGHAYFGYVDAIGRQNIWDLSVGAQWRPVERLQLELVHHAFWRAEREDAVYNAGGGVLIGGGASDSRWIGNEVDLLAAYQFDRHWNLTAGWSRFFAGDVPEDAGGGQDITFLYFIATFTF